SDTMGSSGSGGCVRSVRVCGARGACSWILPSHGIRPGPLSNGGCGQVEAHSGYAKAPAGAGVLLVAPTGVDPVTFRFSVRRVNVFPPTNGTSCTLSHSVSTPQPRR